MSEEIGSIHIKVGLATEGLKKGAAEAKEKLGGLGRATDKTAVSADKLNKSSKELRSGLGGLAVAAFAAAGGIAAVIGATSKIVSFDDAVLGLKATIKGTDAEMALMEAQARKLGASTIYSATQTAEAQRFLAQAGFDVNEVLSATPGILNLATAGSMGLAEAADLASNVLGGFSLEVSELARVNDVLAATASSSNTSVNQLGIALSYAAPLAKSAGISIEETAASIGVLSDAGIQGSRAGTGLIGVIRQLSKITPQAETALLKYGLTSDDVNIKSNGLQSVLETLKNANIGVTDSFTIFGSEANAAAEILSSGSQRVDEMTESLKNSKGAAQAMADIMGSGLSAAMKSFSSAAAEVILVIGDRGGKSGMIAGISAATEIMRDLGLALDYAGDDAKSSSSDFEVIDMAIRGLAVSAKAVYEVMSSLASAITLVGSVAGAMASGDLAYASVLWDDYNDKIKDNIAQTELFYKMLFPTENEIAIRAVNAELDILLDLAEEGEAALNRIKKTSQPKSENGGITKENKEEGESTSLKAQKEKIKLLEEEFNWKKDLAIFDGEGIIEANAERELEASQAKLDAVKEYFKSDLEILIEANEARQYVIDEALLNEQISAEDHESLMAQISADGAAARKRLADEEGKGKLAITMSLLGKLSTLMNTSNKEMFEIGKKAALASAAIDGSRAVMSAWRSGMETPGPWAPLVAAGYAAVAGINAINLIGNISSQSFGVGGSPSAPSMDAAQPAAPVGSAQGGGGGGQQSPVGGTLTVEGLSAGSLLSGDMVAELAEQLLDYQAAGGNVVLK